MGLMNTTVLSKAVLRKARKGLLVSYKGSPYVISKVSFKRDRVWLTPAMTKFMPKWCPAKKEYVADIVRDVTMPVIEVSKRMLGCYDRKRAQAVAEFRTATYGVKESYNQIFGLARQPNTNKRIRY
jgi:hypothetical protein